MFGPILFLVYINDLPSELSSQVHLFADDTVVYLTVRGTEDGNVLQTDPDRLSVVVEAERHGVQPSKCQVVRMTTARDIINTVYILHGQVLKVVTSAKYLRLISPMAYRGTPTSIVQLQP